jgi:two-component system, sensor histidine kinase
MGHKLHRVNSLLIRAPSANEVRLPRAGVWEPTRSRIQLRLSEIHAAAVRFFQRPPARLTNTQRHVLDRRLLEALARRAGYWSIMLLFASILVFVFGVPDQTDRNGLSIEMWAIGLWSLMLPYGYLLFKMISLADDVSVRKLRQLHFLWCIWLTTMAFWWLAGNWALISTRPPWHIHPGFILYQVTFVRLTLTAHVLSVLFLTPSIIAILSVLMIGFVLPFILGILPEFHEPYRSEIIVSFAIYLSVYAIMGAILWRDQRITVARWILSEAERARATLFISAISHDLRQPLTALALRIRSLKRKSTAPEFLSEIAELEIQSQVLENMINATLDISRLDAGTWQVDIREVALPVVIARLMSDLNPEAIERNLRLECYSTPYVVRTDPAALERILRNLIGNALRYTPQITAEGAAGSVVLECEVRGDHICISVIDNGMGIPQNKLEDIFKEYVQLDNAARDRNKGLGLGLSIVKGLAALLGHRLAVTSIVGKGSRFSVYVPIAARIPTELLGANRLKETVPDLAGMVVAFIEDDESSREALTITLIEWGCYVLDGASAEEVLQKIASENTKVHCILSDYRLVKGATGIDAISCIRDAVKSPIPAAIWTAETSPAVLREIVDSGFDHLRKPPDEAELIALLSKYRPMPTAEVVI